MMNENRSAENAAKNPQVSARTRAELDSLVRRLITRVGAPEQNIVAQRTVAKSAPRSADIRRALQMVVDAGSQIAEIGQSHSNLSQTVKDERIAKQRFCEDIENKVREWEETFISMAGSYEQIQIVNRILLKRCQVAEKRARLNSLRHPARTYVLRKMKILPARKSDIRHEVTQPI